jgi:hypothetical protein
MTPDEIAELRRLLAEVERIGNDCPLDACEMAEIELCKTGVSRNKEYLDWLAVYCKARDLRTVALIEAAPCLLDAAERVVELERQRDDWMALAASRLELCEVMDKQVERLDRESADLRRQLE